MLQENRLVFVLMDYLILQNLLGHVKIEDCERKALLQLYFQYFILL